LALSFCLLAEQLAATPPQTPLQVHVQGPEPETAEAVPTLQRLEDGAEAYVSPLDEPQTPFAEAVLFELQLTVPEPLQVHVQGPEPETNEAVPALQRLVVGFTQVDPPLAEPQAAGQAGIVHAMVISGLGNGHKLSATVTPDASLHSTVLD